MTPHHRLHRGAAGIAAAVLVASLSACASEPTADPRAELLVSVDWLAEHLDDPNVVLLHVGAPEDYQAQHIPGAYHVTHVQMSHPDSHSPDALILELPDPAAFEETLEGFGVSADSRIVVYWGSEWVTPTARLVFTLDWAGLGDRTVLLNGGLAAWKAAGHAVTGEEPAPGSGDLTLSPRPELVVQAEWVQQYGAEAGYALVDGRARAFYDGVREDRGKAGHIPGAGSVPWTELIDDSLHLKSPGELGAIFTAAGVGPGDTVVAYCHIGQYATAVMFAARTLGHEVKLYDGAFQDWAGHDLPVEVSAEDAGDR
jgi:thiosulfate/3-mercaptopyruvate sulfurtransferase